jgi:hypothetical protein
MKYILLLSIFLTGCVTAPVKHKMPDLPKELSEKCQALKQVSENEEKLSELLKVINQNYGLYYDCMIKQESLVEWYSKQKKIHDDVHN